jgi:radical SAM superfamily enzyme YgiQ (UPF0313 family)
MEKKPVLLIAFYNKKALGVRCLERSLVRSGRRVHILYLKDFNSKRPEPVSSRELTLAADLMKTIGPGLIGLSVMSSLYMESVIAVNAMLREKFDIPLVWGGIYATLFAEKSLSHTDLVLRGECEEAIVELADAVCGQKDHRSIANLAYRDPVTGKTVINELRPLCSDLDSLGYPLFDSGNKYFIENGRISYGDPLTDSMSYELSASRGCPFRCSYCSSVNIRRMYGGHGRYVRFRSVSSIVGELEEAMAYMKNLKVIHFWDEIFPDGKSWIDEFALMYKSRIGLPFEIWGHPLRCGSYALSKLTDAGLYKVVMGIQSGSPRIRSEIFRRSETQAEILEASEVLNTCRVPQVVYDFMLRHPFENPDDIKHTYDLCTKLKRPFELQLHGLSFLPGTDITGIAEACGIPVLISESGPDNPMQEVYKTYWGQKNGSSIMDYWYALIYLSQFRLGLPLSKLLSKASGSGISFHTALLLQKMFHPAARLRYYYKKAVLLARAMFGKGRALKADRHTVQYNEGK